MGLSITSYRYLISRRLLQITLLVLFWGANTYGWIFLKGNFSAATVAETIPLTDPYALLQILFTGFIGATDVFIGGVIVFLFYAIIAGRSFCSWVCPVNLMSDFARFLNSKFTLGSYLTISKNTRYVALGLGLVLSSILGLSAFEIISPIGILHRGIIFGVGSAWAIIGGLFLFDLVVTKNGWCGHICPLGAFYASSTKYSLLTVNHKKDNCTNCMKCFQVCPEKQVLGIVGKKSGLIKHGECTNCARCIEVCEDDALHFTLNRFSNQNIK